MCVMDRRDREDMPQERDRHLDVPAEANRDKHVNFPEDEERESGRAAGESDSPFYIPGNTPLRHPNSGGDHRA